MTERQIIEGFIRRHIDFIEKGDVRKYRVRLSPSRYIFSLVPTSWPHEKIIGPTVEAMTETILCDEELKTIFFNNQKDKL